MATLPTPDIHRTHPAWRLAQVIVWLVGFLLLHQLLFAPTRGIHLFWNILIPVAPALLVLATGVWRNICPLAFAALLPRRLGLSQRRSLSLRQSGRLQLAAVVLLLILVPLRHAFFNLHGPATAGLVFGLVLIAATAGYFFEWKSAWCAGLCPIHPVERLYGSNAAFSPSNAHCDGCRRCVALCPDSTPNIHPLTSQRTRSQIFAGHLLVGGFPGFIWGWFQVPDRLGVGGIGELLSLYLLSLLGMVATLAPYLLLLRVVPRNRLMAVFATASVSCYYAFRIPALFGFGRFPEDGRLIDLTDVLPGWSIDAAVLGLALFFFWWMVVRHPSRKSWVLRPEFTDGPQ